MTNGDSGNDTPRSGAIPVFQAIRWGGALLAAAVAGTFALTQAAVTSNVQALRTTLEAETSKFRTCETKLKRATSNEQALRTTLEAESSEFHACGTELRTATQDISRLEKSLKEASEAGAPIATPTDTFFAERVPNLGLDSLPITAIRVTIRTGDASGAGTNNHIRIWFDNMPFKVTDDPGAAFKRRGRASTELEDSQLPSTLGELRRASILLSLDVENLLSMNTTWQGRSIKIEVLLPGGSYRPYLESDLGWFQQSDNTLFSALQ